MPMTENTDRLERVTGIHSSVIGTIGRTPMIRLGRLAPEGATVLVKCEFFNPMASVKDRIGWAMIKAGEEAGEVNEDTHIIEPTSGNTGIALAFICARAGYRLTLTMPESMSVERRALLKALGANLVLTPASEGINGAIERAKELVADKENAWMPQQFENPANPQAHYDTTGPEVWNDTDGKVDMFVAGVGTGGTLSGTSRYLKEKNPHCQGIAVEPATSPVITQTKKGLPIETSPHQLQGIGTGFIPRNCDTKLIDSTECVSDQDAFMWAHDLALEEGIFGGISTGANVCAACRIAERPQNRDKVIVTVAASFGERYLSTPLFEGLRY